MSYIARKLCEEIVDPALEQSSTKTIPISQRNSKKSGVQFNDKVSRSVIVEKKKVINTLFPNECNEGKSIVNNYLSKEILLNKEFLDISVNTLITGPIHCDIDRNNVVRKRENCKNCMCSRKRGNCKLVSKQTQTLCTRDYLHTDKATAQSIKTDTCGTQFFKNCITKDVLVSVGSEFSNKFFMNSKHLLPQPSRNIMDISSKHLSDIPVRSINNVASKNLSDIQSRNIMDVSSKSRTETQPIKIKDVSNRTLTETQSRNTKNITNRNLIETQSSNIKNVSNRTPTETQPRNTKDDSSSSNTRSHNFDYLSYKHWALSKYSIRRGPDF